MDINSSKYSSLGPAMNSNQFQKMKTKDYPSKNNFEANSIGRHMDIDASQKETSKKVSDSDSQDVADINDTASAVVMTDEDKSVAVMTILNAENTFRMGNSYKDPPKTNNYQSSMMFASKANNN